MTREFYLLFKKHNVIIPYSQVTINPQDPTDRKKASDEQLEVSKRTNNVLRGIEGKKVAKKRTVSSAVKESLDKTRRDLE